MLHCLADPVMRVYTNRVVTGSTGHLHNVGLLLACWSRPAMAPMMLLGHAVCVRPTQGLMHEPQQFSSVSRSPDPMPAVQPQEFSKICAPLFKQIARCLNSSHFQVRPCAAQLSDDMQAHASVSPESTVCRVAHWA